MFTTLKIAKEWNLEERQTFDDGDPYQSVYVQGYQCLTNTLWTMCHANDATIDFDRFF